MVKRKTFVEDIERTLYDIRNEDRSVYKTQQGLTEAVVRDISKQKMIRRGCWNSVSSLWIYIIKWLCPHGARISPI